MGQEGIRKDWDDKKDEWLDMANKMKVGLVLCCIVAVVVSKTVPFADTYASVTDAACLKEKYSRMSFRVYEEIGKVDPYAAKNLAAAAAVGIEGSLYMNPCVFCGKPEAQIEEIATALKGQTFATFWISVQGSWTGNVAKNLEFLRGLVTAAKGKGWKVGIFTFAPTWERLMGKECTEFSNLPLWYIRWNKSPEPTDFTPFGGWKQPTAKQYHTNNKECGIHLDHDSFFEPDF